MATPIKATPIVKGQAAEKIVREIRNGTPSTPKRVQTIRRADNVYQGATSGARRQQGK